MLPGFECAARELEVRGDGRRDGDRFEVRVGEKLFVVGRGARRRVAPRDLVEVARVLVADPAQHGLFVLDEVPYKVRPPVAAADDSDSDGHLRSFQRSALSVQLRQ